MSSFPRVANLFGEASATPTPAANPSPAAAAAVVPSPAASETAGHSARKATRQAPIASKPAANAAVQIVEPHRTKADVSLENNPGGSSAEASRSSIGRRETPSSAPSTAASGASVASATLATPTLGASALESSRSASDGNPEKAAKLIQDVDKIEKRVDRKNLSSDDSQRDILAQKLMQEARKALAEHDSVAAISLATKASTLLEPLPKLADSDIPSSP